MDLVVLKKRLSTFRTESGKFTKVSDDLLVGILLARWQWPGPAGGFYSALGADHRKMASLIGRSKKLKREGRFPEREFKETKLMDGVNALMGPLPPCSGIEIAWNNGKLIRVSQVEQSVDFLKMIVWRSYFVFF